MWTINYVMELFFPMWPSGLYINFFPNYSKELKNNELLSLHQTCLMFIPKLPLASAAANVRAFLTLKLKALLLLAFFKKNYKIKLLISVISNTIFQHKVIK